ncbi:MAG TPA: DUF1080 domain-containing protein [Fibrobacteria bacterium]|nr:DUF1080 domain-containing protein [Fibrobacteria bacterium]
MKTTIGRKSGMRILGACALLVCGAWGQAKNTLTQAEADAGYKLLFNGANLDGWRSYNNTTPPASWQVVAESTWKVLYIQSGSPTSSLITTDATYRNFDLMIEWNIASNGNSGIFIRYNKFNLDGWGGASGPEAQIGATNNSDATAPKYRAGTCYDMFPLLDKAKTWDGTPNYGKWQQFRIIAYEGHVAHYGNGIKLLEYVIRSPAWNSAYNASKYASYPDYATVHPGSIYLQHHGEYGAEAPRFRNIRIKKLTENPWTVGSPYLANPNDTTALKDLAFSNLMLDKPTITLAPLSARPELAIFPAAGGYRIRFNRTGDYQIRTQDWLGRSHSVLNVGNAGEAWLPAVAAQGASVLSIWSGDIKIHSGPIPAR